MCGYLSGIPVCCNWYFHTIWVGLGYFLNNVNNQKIDKALRKFFGEIGIEETADYVRCPICRIRNKIAKIKCC